MKCNRNEKRIAVLFLSVCFFWFFFVFAFLYLQKGSPRLEFAKTQLEIYTIKKNPTVTANRECFEEVKF